MVANRNIDEDRATLLAIKDTLAGSGFTELECNDSYRPMGGRHRLQLPCARLRLNNKLSGNIPAELGKLSQLQCLVLYDNKLRGTIPAELGNLSLLQILNLTNNKLRGNIPAALDNLSQDSSLQRQLHQQYVAPICSG